MKRIVTLLLIVVLLSGCSLGEDYLDRAIALRSKILQSNVTFNVELTADYGDKTYSFAIACEGDTMGNLKFRVTEPESIAGITGTVSKGNGKLTFDDQVLGFDMLAEGLISPVSGPWVFLETLRSGYLTSCGKDGDRLRIAIDDSYEENALHLDIWLDQQDLPEYCEIYWQGRRLLSMTVKNFTFV